MVGLRLGFLVIATAFLLHAGPALASLSDEVSAGKALAAQVERGQASCATLSDEQFEHLGEYAMDRLLGSRAAHEAMNDRMTRAVGADNADRMHELMGRRYAGCTSGNGTGLPMGPAMMGGGGWDMMGSRFSSPGDHHWSTAGVVAIVTGAALVSAALALVAARRPRRRRPPTAPTPA